MSNKTKQDGELSEQQLDRISGGQQVVKMGTIEVTAKRPQPDQKVVKMGSITVTAERDKADQTRVVGVSPKKK